MLATAPGARLSATIAAFSAALQRRRRGVPVRTSTRRKLCPSIGKLLGKPASLPRLNKAGSSLRPQLPQYGGSVSLTLRLYAGELDRAIEHIETALRLSPRERIGTPLVVIGLAYFFQRRFDRALAKLLLAIQENPGSPATYRILVACYAHMGRLAEARGAVTELRRITPLMMPSTLPWRMTEHRELLLSGLRLAGVENG